MPLGYPWGFCAVCRATCARDGGMRDCRSSGLAGAGTGSAQAQLQLLATSAWACAVALSRSLSSMYCRVPLLSYEYTGRWSFSSPRLWRAVLQLYWRRPELSLRCASLMAWRRLSALLRAWTSATSWEELPVPVGAGGGGGAGKDACSGGMAGWGRS